MTQGRRLIEALKTRRMTYLEMNLLGISVSPHKRIMESLRPDEVLQKARIDGKTYWKVIPAYRDGQAEQMGV
jgi:hypothetical protein